MALGSRKVRHLQHVVGLQLEVDREAVAVKEKKIHKNVEIN